MMEAVMARWWVSVAFAMVVSTTAVAQPEPDTSHAATTEHAGLTAKGLSQRIVQLGAQRVQLQKLYLAELDVIDRLKNQRPSWRRDRELRDSLSSSLETANQLSAVDREIDRTSLQ